MKKLVKEQLNEEFEEEFKEEFEGEYEDGLFAKDDGWDEDALDELGLIPWIESVEKLAYELRNARRGSYALRGDTAQDLLGELHSLKETLDSIVEDVAQQIENA